MFKLGAVGGKASSRGQTLLAHVITRVVTIREQTWYKSHCYHTLCACSDWMPSTGMDSLVQPKMLSFCTIIFKKTKGYKKQVIHSISKWWTARRGCYLPSHLSISFVFFFWWKSKPTKASQSQNLSQTGTPLSYFSSFHLPFLPRPA